MPDLLSKSSGRAALTHVAIYVLLVTVGGMVWLRLVETPLAIPGTLLLAGASAWIGYAAGPVGLIGPVLGTAVWVGIAQLTLGGDPADDESLGWSYVFIAIAFIIAAVSATVGLIGRAWTSRSRA